tara:strand:+ start:65 stop:319 length:255 start_codon:yes stop_codon:yes gene_type:complete
MNTGEQKMTKTLDASWSHIMTNTKTNEQLFIKQIYCGSTVPSNEYKIVKDNIVINEPTKRPAESKTWVLTDEGDLLKFYKWGRA